MANEARKSKFKDFSLAFFTIFNFLKPYKRKFVSISIIGFLAAVLGAFVPYITGLLIDSIVSPDTLDIGGVPIQAFVFFLFAWASIEFFSGLFSWYIARASLRVGTSLWRDYILSSFERLLKLPLYFYKTHKIGEMRSSINKTAGEIDQIVGSVILNLTPQFLSILISFAIVAYINIFLTFVLLAGIFVYLVVLVKVARPLVSMQAEFFKEWRRFFGDIDDSIDNIRQIKDAATEDDEMARAKDASKSVLDKRFKMISVWQDMNFYQQFVILGTRVVIFIVSTRLIFLGQMTVGELLAFNGYAMILFGPFVSLGTRWQDVQNGLVDINENENILNSPKENYFPDDSSSIKKIEGNISFSNVDFYYHKDSPILKNLTFEINMGETVALVGESGVGKTTLIDLISAYHFPVRGTITIDGYDISAIPLGLLRSKIGVVSQDITLFNDTIKRNIAYGSLNATDAEIEEAAKKSHALDFIEKFPDKWDQIVGSRGIKLSGGQRQRVAIARAILRNPKILILDEPTSSLDAKSESIIKESFRDIMRGRTTIIIAHRLSTIKDADKIVVLKDGGVAEVGRHHELLNNDGEYKRLYDLQIGLFED